MLLEQLVRGGLVRATPNDRIIGIGDDPVGIVLAERLRFVGGADFGGIEHAVLDRLVVAERRRFLGEGDEIAGEERAVDGVRLLTHLRGDERSEVCFAQFRPFLVDDLDVGPELFQFGDKGRRGVAPIGIVGGDRRDGFDVLPLRHQRGAGLPLDSGIRGNPEDVGVQLRRLRQFGQLRRRRDEDNLVLLGDGRDRRRLGRGQGAGKEIDAVLDDQLACEAHCLVCVGLAVAGQQLELAAEHPAFGVDLGDRHLGALQNRNAIGRGGTRKRDRKPDFDRSRRPRR